MLIDFAITNYKSIKDTIHLNMVYNTTTTTEELDTACNYDNYIDFFKVPTGNGDDRINVCPVMALFGANASGKSNILKAFLTLRAIVLNGYTEVFYTPFKFSAETENAPTKFEITFSNDSATNQCIYTYGIEYSAHRIEREYLLKVGKTEDTTIYDTANKDYFDIIPKDMWQLFVTRRKPCSNIYLGSNCNSTDIERELKEGFEAIRDLFDKLIISDDINLAPISNDPLVKNTVKNWLFRMDMKFCDIYLKGEQIKVEELDDTLSFSNVEDIQKQIKNLKYPDDLITFEFDGNNAALFTKYNINMKYAKDGFTKKDGQDNTVSINYVKDESTGTKNLFRFLFVLIDALQHGKIIIFDEIDRTIHTELLQFLFGIIHATNLNKSGGDKYGAQMICSSHNPCIIKTVGHQGTMFVEKENNLSTVVCFLSEYEYETNTVLNDYLNGWFGGTPRVIDVFETMEVPNAA